MGGLTKSCWQDVRGMVQKIDVEFASLVDEINPDQTFPLYVSCYNYGEKIGDNIGTFLKNDKEESYRLGDINTPAEIMKNLGYGATNSPLMMILDKTFEWFVFDKKSGVSFPIYIEGPGFFIGTRQLLTDTKPKTYLSSAHMSCCAGTRSSFMLPNIGNQRNHTALHSAPKDMLEHWCVFKEIDRTNYLPNWEAKILFFSEKWVENLKNNPRWVYLQRYLVNKMIKSWEHDKNSFFYNFAFSTAKLEKNIIKNPYLNETAKHILGIAMGANIGFKPCIDDQSLPLTKIQEAYIEIYQLKQTPIVLEPTKFDLFSRQQLPVYYSLQRPIICSLEKQTKTELTALINLLSLSRMLSKYKEAFSSTTDIDYYTGTSLKEVAERVEFAYYHHAPKEIDSSIQSSAVIEKEDGRFSTLNEMGASFQFPSDAKFFRGCIKITN